MMYFCLPSKVSVFLLFLEVWLKISVLGKGTVQPISPFDAVADAKKLHDGLTKGDEGRRDVAELVSTRSCEQRLKIKESFEKDFGSLDNFTPKPPDYPDDGYIFLPSIFKCNVTLYAYHIDRVFGDGWSSDTELIEILLYCSQTAELHDELSKEYNAIYNKDLAHELDKCLDWDFHNVVMEMMTRKRAAKSPNDPKFIQDTAQALLDEKKKWENHRQELDRCMFELSLDVLKEVLNKFKELNDNKDFADAVDGITTDYTYKQIYSFVMDQTRFYAQMLDYSFGRYTDQLLLMRVVLITSETSLVEVEQTFPQVNYEKSSLRNYVDNRIYLNEDLLYKTYLYGFLKYSLP